MRKRISDSIPPQEHLRELIDYDPVSGIAAWKSRPVTRPHDKTWNSCFAGKQIGGRAKTQYFWISIHDVNYLLHRVIFKWMTGKDVLVVDHKDLDKKNNKWDNLREADQSQNRCNAPTGKSSKSGVKGLFLTRSGKWQGKVTLQGQHYWTARFQLEEDAKEALEKLRSVVHGDFAKD